MKEDSINHLNQVLRKMKCFFVFQPSKKYEKEKSMKSLQKIISLMLSIVFVSTPLIAGSAQTLSGGISTFKFNNALYSQHLSWFSSPPSLSALQDPTPQATGISTGNVANNMSRFKIFGDQQTIQVGQSARVRAGFYSSHASCIVSEENANGTRLRSTTYSPVYGNGAYITYNSSVFNSPGTYYIRYHCPDNNTHAYDDVFTIYVTPSSTPSPTSTIRPTATPIPTPMPTPMPTPKPNNTDDYPNSIPVLNTLSTGQSTNANINYAGDVDVFKFVASTSGNHTFRSTGTTDVYGYLLNVNGNELSSNDDSDGTRNFKITYALTAGQIYYLKVNHYSSSGTGPYGLKVELPSSKDTQAPTVPTNLTTTTIEKNSISLKWDASSDNVAVTGYEVYRNAILVSTVTSTSFTHTGLTSDTNYTYSIKAIDAQSNRSSSSISVSVTTHPDWYTYSLLDEQGNTVQVYLSEVGGSIGEKATSVKAYTKQSNQSQYKEFVYSGDQWSSSTMLAYDPIHSSSGGMNAKAGSFTHVRNIQTYLENKKNELYQKFLNQMGMNITELTSEDIQMIKLGISHSIDNNVLFGALQNYYLNVIPEDNYYYMVAKTYTDALFVAAYFQATYLTSTMALNAPKNAGLSGTMAIATSASGVGGAGFGVVAVEELARAAAISGVSYLSGKMGIRSGKIMASNASKLGKVKQVYLDALAKIDNRLQNIKTTSKVKKSAEAINEYLKKFGYDKPPYKPSTPVYQIKLAEKTTFYKVYDVNINNIKGQFVMKLEDIVDSNGNYLSAAQIKDKFALPFTPKAVAKAEIPAGTTMNTGIANKLDDWGNGGAVQFDLNGVRTGYFEEIKGVILK
jgi:hypothetical protein